MSQSITKELEMLVEKRNGEVVAFNREKIKDAISSAAIAAGQPQQEVYESIVADIAEEVSQRFAGTEFHPNVENIQDIVEKHLMKNSLYEVAKKYIVYRADKQREREEERKKLTFLRRLTVTKRDGRKVLFNPVKVKSTIDRIKEGLDNVDTQMVFEEACKNVYDGIKAEDIDKALVLGAIAFTERDPQYSFLAARLFSQKLRKEVFGVSTNGDTDHVYRESFMRAIRYGVEKQLLDPRLAEFNLDVLAEKLVPSRDNLFKYMGIATLYERYLLKNGSMRFELPQIFWMRVAMGLSINEPNREQAAIEFYETFSQLQYVPSTPTLFHAGTPHAQLSSCYLTTIDDDLKDIFKSFADNSLLSKWSGGIGNDWSNIRSIGAMINSTKVESQGSVPFLRIANDTTVAINRSGKRRGATVAYMEAWHCDIQDFLDLRKNTGDERRRTPDMNTAIWIPDLFMKRVQEDGEWTLFSPSEVPDLHHIYGKKFEAAYLKYEKRAKKGIIKHATTMQAKALWRKLLTMLFETGHPWLTFKDPCNVRSPQDHVGVVHSSNLCTEITLNTKPSKLIEEISADGILTRKWELGEVAVCNLGSINLAQHVTKGRINRKLLAKTVQTAMQCLDNVIDLNYYPIPEAKYSNLRHRPVGLGMMGLQDALYMMNVPFESNEAMEFVDEITEFISYHAILGSSKLAKERGSYETFKGSKWDRGLLPIDTIDLLEAERGQPIEVDRTTRMPWDKVREHIAQYGMRNSNTMAIAPTATIANISGVFPCIEAAYKNIYVKSNMSGEFTVVNDFLVDDLKALGLWDQEMLDQIKYHDGSIQAINRIPKNLRDKYKEAFEIDQHKCVDMTALRAKWIDQSQSHNLFMAGTSGRALSDIYMYAWKKGLKTTYYLRSLGASQIEKSTLDASKFGFTQKREYVNGNGKPHTNGHAHSNGNGEVKMCRIDDPNCEACQ